MASPKSFSSAPEVHSFSAILFDMDGTIIDSTAAIVRHWSDIGKDIGVDPSVILATSHGRRSIDVLKEYDPSKANWEYVRKAEGLLPLKYGDEAVEIPGSRKLLTSLGNTPWAIVTSGSEPLIEGWLKVMSLTHPPVLVSAESVTNGKPDPEGYKLAREKLGISPDAKVLVVEDAPAGIRAGLGAGCEVLALVTSHSEEEVEFAGPDWVVKDLLSLKVLGWSEEEKVVKVEISNALEIRD